MAAGEDNKAKDGGGDAIERAMRKRAEAEAKAAAAKPSVVGSAMEKAAAAATSFTAPKREPAPKPGRTFYEPLPSDKYEPALYEPDESSFFAPSAEERADQARRAAQRVRRRAKGEDPDPIPAPESARAPVSKTPPPVPKPAPVAKAPPPAPQPAPVAKAPPPAPVAKTPPPAPQSTPIAKAPPPAPQPAPVAKTPPPAPAPVAPTPAPSKPVVQKPEPVQQPVAPTPVPPAPVAETPPVDLISRSAETVKPAIKIPTFAKVAAAVPIIERLTAPKAKAKSTATVTAPSAPKVTKPKPTRSVRTSKAKAPASRKTPQPTSPAERQAQQAQSTPQPAAGDFESVYADTPPSRAEQPVQAPLSVMRTAKTKAFAPFEWMIASRYLRARKKEGFVSVIAGFSLVGIALGVATLIVVMAVMTGFRETLITQIIGGSPHINVQAQADKFETFDAVAQNIRGVPGVTYVTPVVQGQVLGTGRRGHSGVVVRGMRKADLEQLITSANPQVTNGSLDNFEGDSGVAVGANLAAKLGLRVGDFISLISPDGDITPFQATPMPRKKDYKIIYTFKLGVQQIDYNMAFMPFEEAQIYFNKQGVADTLDVFVEDAQNVENYSDPIFNSARSSISLYNWKTQNGSLIGAINLERQVMFVILTMIILVAALNIISGLVMLVKDKSRDVAIMRTMGMARGSILRIFFICGSSIGVVGSFLGVLLGVLFVWNIKSVQTFVEWATGTSLWDESVRAGITEIPTKMQFGDVALTLFIALGLSFLATLYPAWKAAKLDPVEALRYE